MKKTIKLNEAKLRKIIEMSVKSYLNEGVGNQQMTNAYRSLNEAFVTIMTERAKVNLGGDELFNAVINEAGNINEWRNDITTRVKEYVFPLIDKIYDELYHIYDFYGTAEANGDNGYKWDNFAPIQMPQK